MSIIALDAFESFGAPRLVVLRCASHLEWIQGRELRLKMVPADQNDKLLYNEWRHLMVRFY